MLNNVLRIPVSDNQEYRPCHSDRTRARGTAIILPVLLFLLSLLTSCYARPGAEDLKRVREQFLQLRFQAALSTEYRGKSDRELFEMACRNNRVRCEPLLDMLKEQDPTFYEKVQGTK